MKLNVIDIKGSVVGEIEASKNVFSIVPNDSVVRQAILAELTNLRQGTHATKNRALVSGGGRKPWKQKGRGVARAGTIRSPLWKGGGAIFGPESHSYNHKLSKKMSLLSRKSVLSNKVNDNSLIIVDNFALESHKTSQFFSILKLLKLERKKITLLITDKNDNLEKAIMNLSNVYMVNAKNVSTYELVDCDVLLVDKKSFEVLTEILSG